MFVYDDDNNLMLPVLDNKDDNCAWLFDNVNDDDDNDDDDDDDDDDEGNDDDDFKKDIVILYDNNYFKMIDQSTINCHETHTYN